MISLTGLFIYPVKSARGVALREAEATAAGLQHDRRFMWVDPKGRFSTQRDLPALARLVPRLAGDELALSFDEAPELRVPLSPTQGERRRVRVWSDEVDALDLGEPSRSWATRAFGQPLSLVYMDDPSRRQVDPSYANAGDYTAFADGFPYLLTSEASLADLNGQLQTPVPMNRFRPNLVVSGADARAEDGWARIEVGPLAFELVKPCTRCVITTTDQERGERQGPEPLATLSRTHRWQGKAIFGQNLLPRGEGTLRLGEEVRVVALHPDA